MKKRAIALTLVVCLIVAAGMTGCGSSKPYGKYDLSEYVKVGNYKGLEVEKIKVSVSDEEVDTQVKANVEATKKTEKVKEGKVKKGDKANIDYEGKIDGKAFDGGSSAGTDLDIGSNTFIDGFEKGLIGKKIGSTQDLKLKFPKEYPQNEKLAGKKVVFTVKINYVSKDNIPKYDEKWIEANSKVKTKKEYEKQVKDKIYKEKEEEAKVSQINNLLGIVAESAEVKKYPDKEVEEYSKQLEAQYASMAKQYGMELSQLWQQQGFKTEEEYKENIKKSAQEMAKQQMSFFYIADKEDLTYTSDEAKKAKEEIEQAGYTDQTFKEESGMEIDAYVENNLTLRKVGEFLYKHAKFVDKKSDEKADEKSDKKEDKKSDKKSKKKKDK